MSRGVGVPDRLTRVSHRQYLAYAERMLAVYASGVGRPRRELHQSVGAILAGEPDCDARRVAACANCWMTPASSTPTGVEKRRHSAPGVFGRGPAPSAGP